MGEYEGISVFVFKATVAAIERLNKGQGNPETILAIIDRVVNCVKTGLLTRAQFQVICDLLQIDIDIPEEPEPTPDPESNADSITG